VNILAETPSILTHTHTPVYVFPVFFGFSLLFCSLCERIMGQREEGEGWLQDVHKYTTYIAINSLT
jgi:hypothetical protein